jgi:hypothetical protein
VDGFAGLTTTRGDDSMSKQTLLDVLRGYSIVDLERLVEYRVGDGRYVDIYKGLINEKLGTMIYDVPDVATFTGIDDEDVMAIPEPPRWRPGERIARLSYRIVYAVAGVTAGVLCILGCIGVLYGFLHGRTNMFIVLVGVACVGIGVLLIVGSRIAWWVELSARRTWWMWDAALEESRRAESRVFKG